MPSGAKKRKALKKKKQQEATGTTSSNNNSKGFNGDNLHGNDEHGSQDERGSDSTLSSPGSQVNEEFGMKDSSAALSSDMVKGADAREVTQGLGSKSGNGTPVGKRTDEKKNIVDKSSVDSTHTSKNVACQDACGGNSITEIAPVVDSVKHVVSVSKVVISEKSETSTHSNLVNKKSVKNEEFHSSAGLGENNGKVVTLPRSAAETSKKVEDVRKSEILVSSDEKRILLPGPQAVRTSWLSCCGLFDAMTGSDR